MKDLRKMGKYRIVLYSKTRRTVLTIEANSENEAMSKVPTDILNKYNDLNINIKRCG